jgi:transposase
MARRCFDVIDVVEILQHWHAGRSKSQVAASVGVDRATVRKYVAPAEAAGLLPGGPLLSRAEWAALVAGWFPELVDAKARSLTWPLIDQHREQIGEMLRANTVTTVHQRLRDEPPHLKVSITSFRRYVWVQFPAHATAERVTVLRPPVPPGEEAQIDWGFLGNWLEPVTDRVRRVWAFVMVLAACRHMFVRPVLRLDTWAWVEAHVAAFEFFGAVPARLVPDNPRTGVDRCDLYDPKINRAYGELAAHYGCLVDPARRRKPKDKPRVERPLPYVRDSFWRGRSWESIEQMQAAALTWCVEVAGQRRHRSLDGASPYAVFQAVELPAMRPLPVEPFELARWLTPKVGVDCHISVAGVLYSVPWRLIGRHVDVRLSAHRVEVFVDGQLVKTHRRAGRGRQTDYADYPPDKVAFFMRTPSWCRRRAGELGPAVTELVAGLLQTNALHRLRSAQGILGLAERHSAHRLDTACRRALDVGDPTYRTVKGILVAGTETDPAATPAASAAPAHLHGPLRLFNPDEAAG